MTSTVYAGAGLDRVDRDVVGTGLVPAEVELVHEEQRAVLEELRLRGKTAT